ncbi:MAG: hypothetical protein JO325_20730, partial [Solirubrobacterales bacterium]|nr:hypothetical protein [Solirubrobacterales bacterium]
MTFWLQASACTVVGWSLLHGGITIKPAAPPVSSGAVHAPGPASAGVPAAAEGTQPAPPPLASPQLPASP